MARGESGRIVIEIDPETKRRLYTALSISGSTLKEWFLKEAVAYCEDSIQPGLFPRTQRDGPSNPKTISKGARRG
jgi:hypothetical protein